MKIEVIVGSDTIYSGSDIMLAASFFETFVERSMSDDAEFGGNQVVCKDADTGEVLGLLTGTVGQ